MTLVRSMDARRASLIAAIVFASLATLCTAANDGLSCSASSDCNSNVCKTHCCMSSIGNECTSCSNDGKCSTCVTGYYKEHHGDDSCTSQKEAGEICDPLETNPSECKSGLCPSGGFGGWSRCCKNGMDNCQQCEDSGACNACNSGYELNSDGFCKYQAGRSCSSDSQCASEKCRTGTCCPYYAGSACLACSNGYCTSCSSNYHVTSYGTCKASLQLPCTDPACTSCDVSGSCTACAATHYLSGGSCVAKLTDGHASRQTAATQAPLPPPSTVLPPPTTTPSPEVTGRVHPDSPNVKAPWRWSCGCIAGLITGALLVVLGIALVLH